MKHQTGKKDSNQLVISWKELVRILVFFESKHPQRHVLRRPKNPILFDIFL